MGNGLPVVDKVFLQGQRWGKLKQEKKSVFILLGEDKTAQLHG